LGWGGKPSLGAEQLSKGAARLGLVAGSIGAERICEVGRAVMDDDVFNGSRLIRYRGLA